MTYTTHGAMTAADLAEIRRDYDLDLCPCCEMHGFAQHPEEPDGFCVCGHEHGPNPPLAES